MDTILSGRRLAGSTTWRQGILYSLLLSYYTLFGLVLGTTGVLWDDIQKALQIGDGLYGTALLVTPLTGAAMLLLAGPLMLRAGKKNTLLASLAIVALTQICLAFASGLWAFVAVRTVTGIGYGLLQGVITTSVIDWEQATGRKTMNLMHAAFSGGAVVGAVATGALLSASWHYQQVLITLGLIVMIPLALSIPAQFQPSAIVQKHAGAGLRGTWAAITNRKGLGMLVILSLLAAGAEAVAGLWSVIYLRELGASLLVSGAILALFNGAMFVGRLGNAIVVAQAGMRLSLLLSGCGVLVAAGLLIPVHSMAAALAFIVLGLAVAGMLPTILGVAARMAPSHSTAISTVMMEAAFVGVVVAPPAIGWGASLWDLHVAFLVVLGVSGLVMLGLIRALPIERGG